MSLLINPTHVSKMLSVLLLSHHVTKIDDPAAASKVPCVRPLGNAIGRAIVTLTQADRAMFLSIATK